MCNQKFLRATAIALVLASLSSISVPSYAWSLFHGRRNAVLQRDQYLNQEINAARFNLKPRDFRSLSKKNALVWQKAQQKAYLNGGNLSIGQERSLLRSQNRLQRKLNSDVGY